MLRSPHHKKKWRLTIRHFSSTIEFQDQNGKNVNDTTQRRPAPIKTGRFWIIFAADTKSPGSSRVHLGCINLIPYSLSVEGITYITQGWLVLSPFFAAGPPMCCWLKHPRQPLDHCWIPTNERSAAAPLWRTPPFAGDSGNLHRLHGVSCRKMRYFAA